VTPPQDEEARTRLNLEALARGEVPLRAQERIARQAAENAKSGRFTSDLTVNEFLAIREVGFEPVSQVMGSSVYQVAWSGWCQAAGSWGAYATTELTGYVQAMTRARRLALGRLAKEAAGVSAHGVVGVHLTWRYLDRAGGLLEFTALGTAVRRRGAPDMWPFLSGVSGQDFAKLMRAGYVPCGLVIGMTALQIHPGYGTRWQQQSWNNQEVAQFTASVAGARGRAMQELHGDLRAAHADGCVGASISIEVWETPCYYSRGGSREEAEDRVVQFLAIGTAVARYGPGARDGVRVMHRLDDFKTENVEVEI
jgi:uncharacterized protein YbjQ (UPF0145 family)